MAALQGGREEVIRFFGERWDAPNVDDAVQRPTPVGEPCVLFIRPHVFEDGTVGFSAVHRGCEMGTTIGHYFGVCSCTGWDDLYERGREIVRRADAGQLVMPVINKEQQ